MFDQSGTEQIDRRRRHRPAAMLIGGGVVAALLIGACGSRGGSATGTISAPSMTAPSTTAPSTTESPAPSQSAPSETGGRVDLAAPSFSDPTNITNPLFPITEVAQGIQLGTEAGDQLRHEITLLPETKTIEWNGQQVETVVSQFAAYKNGRILEVATDYFAQADDGAVWYFGEDVANYENGVIANHDGTWLAGKDGPPGMIMPADPQVGDVYRPENIPGVVFEEVTVQSIGETVDGPRGPVGGAVLVLERLMDGTQEDKIFAPGYGEFLARVTSADELVTVALGVPIDSVAGGVPSELGALSTGAADMIEWPPSTAWEGMASTLQTMAASWDTYRAGAAPVLLEAQMTEALDVLTRAVEAQDVPGTHQAAIAVARATFDLQMLHRPAAEVDMDRLDLGARQLLVDAAAGKPEAIAGDVATLETIWARSRHTVDASGAAGIDARLGALRAAAERDDASAAARAVPAFMEAIAHVQPA